MEIAKMIKMMKKYATTYPSTNKVEDGLETLQDLSRRDEIRSLLLNMESLLVHERIYNLKQSVATDFFNGLIGQKRQNSFQ